MHQPMPEIEEIVNLWRFAKFASPLAGTLLMAAIYYLRDIARSLKEIGIQQAQVMERIRHHDDRLSKIEEKIID